MSYLIDSNILIYFLNDQLPAEAEVFLKRAMINRAFISVITRIEILSRPGEESSTARPDIDLINQFIEQPLTEEIVQKCIGLRRSRRIKIPDAIIAATALYLQIPLVTRNTDDFENLENLSLINPFNLQMENGSDPDSIL